MKKINFLIALTLFTSSFCYAFEKYHPAIYIEKETVFNKSQEIKVEDPKRDNKALIHYSYERSKSNIDWINNLLDQKTLLFLSDIDIVKVKAESIDELIGEFKNRYDNQTKKTKKTPSISEEQLSINSEFVHQIGNIAVFVINVRVYEGGMHGHYWEKYINIDLNKKSSLSFNDIIPGKNYDKLKLSLWVDYVIKYDPHIYFKDSKEMPLSDNFYLSYDGISFAYDIYELASFSAGIVKLFVSWKEIENLLLPNIHSLFFDIKR